MVDAVDSQQAVRAQAAREAADAVRRDGAELCARLVFRASRNELRRAGITTPAALYDELKQIFWNADEGVTLGDHLSVGFGKVDRRRQVRALARSRGYRSPAPGILAGQNIVVNGHLLA